MCLGEALYKCNMSAATLWKSSFVPLYFPMKTTTYFLSNAVFCCCVTATHHCSNRSNTPASCTAISCRNSFYYLLLLTLSYRFAPLSVYYLSLYVLLSFMLNQNHLASIRSLNPSPAPHPTLRDSPELPKPPHLLRTLQLLLRPSSSYSVLSCGSAVIMLIACISFADDAHANLPVKSPF